MPGEWNIEAHTTALPDLDMVRDALSVLIEPGSTFELRGLPGGTSDICRSIADGLAGAQHLAASTGVYYTLNPCRNDLERPAHEDDIINRRWLFFDIDPVRPANSNSTAAEKAEAEKLAVKVLMYLREKGWPLPITIDSGNGYHLLFRVGLPADALTKQLFKKVLRNMGKLLNTDEAKIDDKVHNNARIAKLPGTWAKKGPHSEDRPHRLCRILAKPAMVECVPVDLIKIEAGAMDIPTPGERPLPEWMVTVSSSGNYVRRALDSEAYKVMIAITGTRHNTLRDAAYAVAGYLWTGDVSENELRQILTRAGLSCGLPEHEVEGLITTGIEKGKELPRKLPDNVQPSSMTIGPGVPDDKPKLMVVGLDEIVPEKVDWLWENRVARGFITVLAGRTGIGKSFVMCDFAARLSRGDHPATGGPGLPIGGTLMISEDPQNTMLAPRFLSLGADPKLIKFMTWEAMSDFAIGDTPKLHLAWEQSGRPDLVIIDPPANFLGIGCDEHKNAEIRKVIMKLVTWLDLYRVAAVLITHFNKANGVGMEALDKIMGSVAWSTTSRIVLGCAKDGDEPTKRIFGGMKNNLGPRADVYQYEIVKTADGATIEWFGSVDADLDDAVTGTVKKKSRGLLAVEWLTDKFRIQREWKSTELKEAAAEAGFTKHALWSPEVNALPIRKRERMSASGDKAWWWIAEEGWPRESTREEQEEREESTDYPPY